MVGTFAIERQRGFYRERRGGSVTIEAETGMMRAKAPASTRSSERQGTDSL